LVCTSCGSSYPIVRGGIPVFIVEESSVFTQSEYLAGDSYQGAAYGTKTDPTLGVRRLARRTGHYLGEIGSSIKHFGVTDAIRHVMIVKPNPQVLVLGSGGTDYSTTRCKVIHTDVAFGERVEAIVDSHDLPFASGSFDLVIAVAVLEHVADPQRCVAEAHRVLAPDGFVYAATPFLQPVHMGAHDFTRFTPLGHRRLFRCFDTISWGLAMGPGTTFAYALSSLLESMSRRRQFRRVGKLVGLLAAVPMRKLDRPLSRAPSSWDAAAATYYFGSRRQTPVPDREIIMQYVGGYRPVQT
jgi:SAM-dependent methyltransferase